MTGLRVCRWIGVLAVMCGLALQPAARAQDDHTKDMEQLQALQQQLLSGADPCTVIPKLKALLTKMSQASPEAANAMKPSLDLLKQDIGCPSTPSPPIPPPPPAGPPVAPPAAVPDKP